MGKNKNILFKNIFLPIKYHSFQSINRDSLAIHCLFVVQLCLWDSLLGETLPIKFWVCVSTFPIFFQMSSVLIISIVQIVKGVIALCMVQLIRQRDDWVLSSQLSPWPAPQ